MVQFPAEANNLSSKPLYPGQLWGPPNLLSNGSFPSGKMQPGHDIDPASAEVRNEYKLTSPPWHLHSVEGQLYLLYKTYGITVKKLLIV
jgi:hypothetical protein